jgi:hypothetical protein
VIISLNKSKSGERGILSLRLMNLWLRTLGDNLSINLKAEREGFSA